MVSAAHIRDCPVRDIAYAEVWIRRESVVAVFCEHIPSRVSEGSRALDRATYSNHVVQWVLGAL